MAATRRVYLHAGDSEGGPSRATTLASEIFERQVYVTFVEEPLGPRLMPLLSDDNFRWACDCPHPDSPCPNSASVIDHALGALGEEAVRKVTGESRKRLYGLP